MIAKVLVDAGFDADDNHEVSGWSALKDFVSQHLRAVQVKEKIEEYQLQLSGAMEFLMVCGVSFTMVYLMRI